MNVERVDHIHIAVKDINKTAQLFECSISQVFSHLSLVNR
jgi:hypothetical protein